MTFAALARALEQGRLRSPATLLVSRLWARRARVARPLALPAGARVIGVGGPTLGGSYKTPLTLALALGLHQRREPVAVVAHAYGAAPLRQARAVGPPDTARTVGDDAVWLSRELDGNVKVFTGPRGEAVALAAKHGTVLVDALLQAVPDRLTLSLLCVDGRAPWGAGACPPAGDLRAPREASLDAADAVVAVLPDRWPPGVASALTASGKPVFEVRTELFAVDARSGRPVSLEALRAARVGVVLAIARPERVLHELSLCGIHPRIVRCFADHATLPEPRLQKPGAAIDVWLTSPKCMTKLGVSYSGTPLAVLRHRLSLPEELLRLCRGESPVTPEGDRVLRESTLQAQFSK